MTVTITKKLHHNYRYLVQWSNDEGHTFSDWYHSKKEIHEYFDRYFPKYVFIEEA